MCCQLFQNRYDCEDATWANRGKEHTRERERDGTVLTCFTRWNFVMHLKMEVFECFFFLLFLFFSLHLRNVAKVANSHFPAYINWCRQQRRKMSLNVKWCSSSFLCVEAKEMEDNVKKKKRERWKKHFSSTLRSLLCDIHSVYVTGHRFQRFDRFATYHRIKLHTVVKRREPSFFSRC